MSLPIIGMVSSYPNLTQSDWLWKQTPHGFGVWGQMQLQAQAPQPDWLLLYQYDIPALVPASPLPVSQRLRQVLGDRRWTRPSPPAWDPQTVFRNVPPERRIFLRREPPLPEVLPRLSQSYDRVAAHCGYVSGPDDYAPHPDYMPAIWYVDQSFPALDSLPIPPKVRPCSWITSGINRSANHRDRLQFLQHLQERLPDSVDYYGRNLPDWVRSGGAVQNKWHCMAPYYYNLAIENYRDNSWYVSEKLWDALLSWCLPLYYGGSAADALIPPESFIRIPSLNDQGIAYIQEVIRSPDLWQERQEAIAEARQIILHKLNLMAWLSDFVVARSG
ncbi:glycosyltransferase family 10 domain-containing protein [Prochlorothrix hollandica]|uniref:Glycosyltransferase n=1 Tax=Prochlorothrix hollandica PCC 9006 = CALU 1027 TaxID=317619 RepID=A0A0M2PUX6_PROHO|nr:glycosyltransferase [Prochlorothrix hollandica PCC 9006 = CALU 1027]